jgi:Flp pilus assembly protein TadG
MRRLTQQNDDGLIAITVTVLAAVLLVMASFAVDIGSAVAVARSAQNSADAAALAVATDCARTGTPSSATPYLTNGQVGSTTGCGAGTVTATVSRTRDWTFGKLVGLGDYTKTRSATAKWGALGSATGRFPITFGTCAFTITFNVPVTLHSYDFGTCHNPAGQFGFVENGCTTQTIAITTPPTPLPGTTGNNLGGTGCSASMMDDLMNGGDLLMPVWDANNGTGSNASYHLVSFAIFDVTGWSTNGGSNHGGTLQAQCDGTADGDPVLPAPTDKNKPCVRGVFKGFTTQSGTVVPGLPCRDNILACNVYLDH